MKEFRETLKTDACVRGDFDVKLANETNIYEWFVYLRGVDPESELYKSLQEYNKTNGQDSIILNFEFPNDFPFSPPFVRVVSPVIYGGHVQVGFKNISTNNANNVTKNVFFLCRFFDSRK